MDLINRQDAIDALSKDIEDCFVLHDAIKSIKSVSSVQQNLVLRLQRAEMFNNSNIPQWAWKIIKEFENEHIG